MEPITHDNYSLGLEEKGGFAFLKLSVSKFSKGMIASLKDDVETVQEVAASRGHELVFAHATDERIVRLWERVRPFYDIEKQGSSDWVAAWKTGV